MSDRRERSSLSLWFFPSHSRPAPSENKRQDKGYRENDKNHTIQEDKNDEGKSDAGKREGRDKEGESEREP